MIEADYEKCIGAGMCALTAPDVFDQNDDDGRVIVLNQSPETAVMDTVREAITLCPANALAFREPG